MTDIEAVKSRLDIVDVISGYIPVQRAGRSYKARCPFHKEKTPSFVITPDMQRFKCFGCGEGGDVISFIQKIERVEFGEALKIAADRAGYELTSTGKKDDKLEKEKQRILEANLLAAKYWNYVLKTHKAGKIGREYMLKRKVDQPSMDKFLIGYSPHGTNLLPFLEKKGFTKQELVSWGLAVERKGEVIDKFRDRFMLPIWDIKGNILAFSGRIVTPNEFAPKYLNSPETLVYHKGDILMGLYQAIDAIRKSKIVILEEGNIDLLSSHRVGVENIVATGGTALTDNQVKLLKRYADTIYFAFDTDEAGIKALIKGIEIAERQGVQHKTLQLGQFQDPDELISNNPDEWAKVIANPQNSIAYLLGHFQKDLDLGNPDNKSAYVKRMVPVLSVLKDKVQQRHFAEQLGLYVGVTVQDIMQLINGAQAAPTLPSSANRASQDKETDPSSQTEPAILPMANRREVYLLALMLEVSSSKIADLEISGEIFMDVNAKEIFVKIAAMHEPRNLSDVADELTDGAKETWQQVLSEDLSNILDQEKELRQTYKSAYKNYLQSKMLSLRTALSREPENIDILSELQYYSRELKQL